MKKIMIALCALTLSLGAQTNSNDTPTEDKKHIRGYGSVGISIGHVDQNDPAIDKFSKASFPSLELGVSGDNVSLGAVFGYENLLATSDTRMFYELKTTLSQPLSENVGVFALFGVGAYGERGFNNFVEYGAGFSYFHKRTGYFVQYSNWARSNYVSVGVTLMFND